MTPEHIKSNLESWADIINFINKFDDPQWIDWQKLALRFMQYGIDHNFNHHFRVGQSMRTLVFSTLDHYGLEYEPRVTVVITPPETIRLIYTPSNPAPREEDELEYELIYSDAMPTFQRFLNHLWEMTRSEPLPSNMKAPKHKFTAPVLSKNDSCVSSWFDKF